MGFDSTIADDAAVETLDRAVADMTAASARMLRAIAECAERRLWERDGQHA